MIKLRQMRLDEYSDYCDFFIDDYSKEIVENYGHSIETAIEIAKQDLQDSFPNGLEFNEHELLCIESTIGEKTKVVGYLWHSIKTRENSTFINDIFIFSNFQNNGYAKQAIASLEFQLKTLGIEEIKLRVAYKNQRALKLYQKIGFNITGYNLFKKI